VRWHKDAAGDLIVDWQESGGPPVREPIRQGFGTTIIRRSIPYDLDGKADVRYDPAGLQARFSIPAKFVTFAEGPGSALADNAKKLSDAALAHVAEKPMSGLSILLVEDNLIIAMDGEHIFLQLGAKDVTLAPSAGLALELLEKQHFDLAVLDVHLGEETSAPVAEKLQEKGTPLIFATGYGQAVTQAGGASGIGLLQKPYTIESVASALDQIMQAARS
jgi:CheY-like chemotaxis protein